MTDDPVATAAQHEQELAAFDLTEHPTVKAAYRTVAETWLGRAKPSDAMRARFDEARRRGDVLGRGVVVEPGQARSAALALGEFGRASDRACTPAGWISAAAAGRDPLTWPAG